MANDITLGETLRRRGVARRDFMRFCAATASLLALPPALVSQVAAALETAKRPSVIWLSFQECTGCTESLTRSHAPTVEGLIFDFISLDYHHTLQAASGEATEQAREEAMRANRGNYILIVDGAIPLGENGNYSAIAGATAIGIATGALAAALNRSNKRAAAKAHETLGVKDLSKWGELIAEHLVETNRTGEKTA